MLKYIGAITPVLAVVCRISAPVPPAEHRFWRRFAIKVGVYSSAITTLPPEILKNCSHLGFDDTRSFQTCEVYKPLSELKSFFF